MAEHEEALKEIEELENTARKFEEVADKFEKEVQDQDFREAFVGMARKEAYSRRYQAAYIKIENGIEVTREELWMIPCGEAENA